VASSDLTLTSTGRSLLGRSWAVRLPSLLSAAGLAVALALAILLLIRRGFSHEGGMPAAYSALCVANIALAAALLACAATGERPRMVKAEMTADQLVKSSLFSVAVAVWFAVLAVGTFALQVLHL
jgi:hypothetical protein